MVSTRNGRSPAEAGGPDGASNRTGRPSPERAGDLAAAPVREIMSTKVMIVDVEDDVLLAWEVMTQAGVHHLPVMDGPRLAGMLDDRRLVREWLVGPLSAQGRSVGEILQGDAPSVPAEATVGDTAAYMGSAHLDAVCVVDDGGRLAGILTTADLVDALAGTRRRNEGETTGVEEPALFRLMPVLPATRARR
jgi:CBS domain-containing protein